MVVTRATRRLARVGSVSAEGLPLRVCDGLTKQGGGAEHFSGWGLKMTSNGDVEKWEDWGVAKFQPLALPSLQRGGGGGGQPYLHFSVEKTLGIGLSTEIELVSCDLFPLPCLTMLFVWVLTTNLLQNEALC